jgi:signal transduction histidine kinase
MAPWWHTWWFRVLLAIGVTGLIVYVIHNYNRHKYSKKIKQLELEHRIQLERERISRDLHDNLGAYATAIVNTVDKVVKNPADSTRLHNLKDNASEIMVNLRDTIWALNKNDISSIMLSDRIKTYSQKIKESYPHLKIDIEESVDAGVKLSPEFALNLLRIVQEALHNAIKHSSGDKITIILRITDHLYISIKDNGNGFGEMSATSEGNGFENMRARAKENKIQLKVSSFKKEGTTIELFSQLQ